MSETAVPTGASERSVTVAAADAENACPGVGDTNASVGDCPPPRCTGVWSRLALPAASVAAAESEVIPAERTAREAPTCPVGADGARSVSEVGIEPAGARGERHRVASLATSMSVVPVPSVAGVTTRPQLTTLTAGGTESTYSRRADERPVSPSSVTATWERRVGRPAPAGSATDLGRVACGKRAMPTKPRPRAAEVARRRRVTSAGDGRGRPAVEGERRDAARRGGARDHVGLESARRRVGVARGVEDGGAVGRVVGRGGHDPDARKRRVAADVADGGAGDVAGPSSRAVTLDGEGRVAGRAGELDGGLRGHARHRRAGGRRWPPRRRSSAPPAAAAAQPETEPRAPPRLLSAETPTVVADVGRATISVGAVASTTKGTPRTSWCCLTGRRRRAGPVRPVGREADAAEERRLSTTAARNGDVALERKSSTSRPSRRRCRR